MTDQSELLPVSQEVLKPCPFCGGDVEHANVPTSIAPFMLHPPYDRRCPLADKFFLVSAWNERDTIARHRLSGEVEADLAAIGTRPAGRVLGWVEPRPCYYANTDLNPCGHCYGCKERIAREAALSDPRRLSVGEVERNDRLERLAFVREWFGWVPEDQVEVEQNELQLDDYQSSIGNHSYLEQVRLWEVGPGEGHKMREALLMLPDLLRELHDAEVAALSPTDRPDGEEVERLREALEPSGDTKAAYFGEFYLNLTRVDECGDEYTERVMVPWTTIKEIMAAISARAALSSARD